jgi:hypothetical protein
MAAPSRWASQAALDTLLRFNPQKQALMEQIKEAQGTYGQTVKAGRTTAKETEASVQRALPQLSQAYGQADIATKPGVTLINQALAQLPPDSAQYRANQAAAGQTFLSNLAGARADAQRMMLERSTRAREGAQFNQQQAGRTLAETLKQLFGKQQALSSEAGAFAQSEAEKLANEAEGRRVTERGQNLTSASAAAGRATTERGQNLTAQSSREGREAKASEAATKRAEKAAAAGKPSWLSPVDHNKARNTIEQIRREAYEHRYENLNYGQSQKELEAAVPSSFTNKAGKKEATPGGGRKGYAYNGLLKAGLDLAYFGGIGGGTAGLLHREHLNVGQLGYPMYKAPKQPTGAAVRQALVQGFRNTGIR